MEQALDNWYEKLLNVLRTQGQYKEILEEFEKCTKDEDRVQYISQLSQVQNILPDISTSVFKSAKESENFRTSGNQTFQRREYNEAFVSYNKSILVAPWKSQGNELALAFANRSAVLYYMQQYVPCLMDIKYAISFGYPLNLIYKLSERKNKCYEQLNIKDETEQSFEQAALNVDETASEQERTENLLSVFGKKLEKYSSHCYDQTQSHLSYNFSHCMLPVKSSDNEQIPCASKAVMLSDSADMGRGLYAAACIDVGEVLIIEKPFVSVLLRNYNLSHCSNCCERVDIPFPCSRCSDVVYCSQQCQQIAWESYHEAECQYLALIQRSELGLGNLALRMVLRAKPWRVAVEESCQISRNNFCSGFNGSGIYDSSDYNTVYNLVGHTKSRSVEDLLKRTLNAVFLLKCLDHYQSEGNCLAACEWKQRRACVGGHILRHLQMLPCNAHEVSELALDPNAITQSQTIEIGSAIYSTLSLINHSCDPSVVRHSYGDRCVVRAIRKIPKGQEIFDNYGALYPLTVRDQRKKHLEPQYFFNCNCRACGEDWPLYFDIPSEIPAFKCQKCSRSVFIPSDNQTQNSICSVCGQVQDITKNLVHLAESDDVYRVALMNVLEGKELGNSIPVFVSHLGVLDNLVVRPWKDYNDCQEALKQCYAVQANCHISI